MLVLVMVVIAFPYMNMRTKKAFQMRHAIIIKLKIKIVTLSINAEVVRLLVNVIQSKIIHSGPSVIMAE